MTSRQPGRRKDLREPEPEMKTQGRKTKAVGRTDEKDGNQACFSSQYGYNFRTRGSPKYKDLEEDDDDSTEEGVDEEDQMIEDDSTPSHRQQNINTSPRSDLSHWSHGDSSHVSSSFSDGHSPVGEVPRKGVYPDLSYLSNSSPEDRRRGIHGRRGLHSDPHHLSECKSCHTPDKPQPESAHPRKHSEEGTVVKTIKQYLWVILLFIVFLVPLVFRHIQNPQGPVSEQMVSNFEEFSQSINALKTKFPGQTDRFWRVVKAGTRHVFDLDLATYPAVLLMVGEKKDAALSARIAEAVQQEFEHVKLKRQPSQADSLNLTATVGQLDMDKQKLYLDNWLKQRLDSNRAAVVVNHLESLQPEAALLLHAYCDGDNAPYKDALLIWGLFLDHPVHTPQEAEEALHDLWMTEFMRDKVGALLSRVANNIVLVKAPSDGTKQWSETA